MNLVRDPQKEQSINLAVSYMPLMKLVRFGIMVGLFFTFIATILIYPFMPDLIPSHWNAAGQVNGYMSKFWGLFMVPFIMAGFVALLMLLIV